MFYTKIIVSINFEYFKPILKLQYLLFTLTIIIFVSIIFKFIRHRQKIKSKDELEKYKKQEVSMDNVFYSINQSKELYKDLSKKCHPDKFIGSEKYHLAEQIFQDLTENKRNYKELLRIKSRIHNELNNN